MIATVYKSTGSWYLIKTDNGKWHEARAAGKLRLKGIKSTNPIAVGDRVSFILEDGDNAVINGIEDRNNYVIRKSNKLSKQTQILASNVDALLIIASIKNPKTSLGFIDRLTVAAVAYKIEPIVCFNKQDLWDSNDENIYKEYAQIYTEAGFKVIACSATENTDIEELKQLLHGKRVILSGHSGVGKSSIINAIQPNLDLRVGAISDTHLKGKHTTTFAEMFDLNSETQYIDTPGIRDFGLIQIDNDELPTYFPELFDLLGECRFYNCKHINEPNCAVIQAVEAGKIAASRYHSYLSIHSNENIFE